MTETLASTARSSSSNDADVQEEWTIPSPVVRRCPIQHTSPATATLAVDIGIAFTRD
jgi:hypothetical protein